MTRRDTVKVVEETGTLLSLQSGMSIQVAVRPEGSSFPGVYPGGQARRSRSNSHSIPELWEVRSFPTRDTSVDSTFLD